MQQKRLEQAYAELARPRLIEMASALGIVGRHRMTKSSLVQALVLVRTYATKRESAQGMAGLTRSDLIRLSELKGIRVDAGTKKAELTRMLHTEISPKTARKPEQTFPPSTPPRPVTRETLPDSYGTTRVVLLPVHPFLMHVYWEVTEEDRKRMERRLGKAFTGSKAVLRFQDLTPIPPKRKRTEGGFDVEIDLDARQWYVHLWSPEKVYKVDLGFGSPSGEMMVLASSNTVTTSRAWPVRNEKEFPAHQRNEPAPGNKEPSSHEDNGPAPGDKEPSSEERSVAKAVHASDFVQRRFAEVYRNRKWTRPLAPLRPPPDRGLSRGRKPNPAGGLTDRCESLFTDGISSEEFLHGDFEEKRDVLGSERERNDSVKGDGPFSSSD